MKRTTWKDHGKLGSRKGLGKIVQHRYQYHYQVFLKNPRLQLYQESGTAVLETI